MSTIKPEDDGVLDPINSTESPDIDEVNDRKRSDENEEDDAKRAKKSSAVGKRPSAEVLQRRKEGRIKAAQTIAQNLKKTGIARMESHNKFTLTSVKSLPLINQKNYYTDYLKKDEQVAFIRNRRYELLQQKLKNLKKNASNDKKDEKDDIKNFDDFDLNDIETEMRKKAAVVEEDEEEEDDEEEIEVEGATEEKAKQGVDTIVIHPGSSNIRMGRATDAYPETVPTVIAIPNDHPEITERELDPKRTVLEDGLIFYNEEFDLTKAVLTKDFKARMRYYKRRMLPNSRETAANYNKKQEPEEVPDHNDPYKKDWLDIEEIPADKKFFVGSDALKLPICARYNKWKLRYPIINGKFNQSKQDYDSPQEVLGDLDHIISESLLQLFDINKSQLVNMKAMLIIPDLYDKVFVESWVNLLFKTVGFGKVGIIQESVAATFGAGASTACVVDIGSQTTSIACVDEGMVINDSRVLLNYGGDHVTTSFIKLLLQLNFPYKDINLNNKTDDWELAQTLKHDFATFQDADIAVQLYNFYRRKPFEPTQKYEFKVYDEVMLAPLGLFYPELFQIPSERKSDVLFPRSLDQYSGKPDNPYSQAQENLLKNENYTDLVDEDLLKKLLSEKLRVKAANPYARSKAPTVPSKDDTDFLITTPLEKAIIESITNAGIFSDVSKMKKFYDNLLIVGGGFSKIPGYDLILHDRINIWRPKFLSSSALDDILDYLGRESDKLENSKKNMIKDHKEEKKQRLTKANQGKKQEEKVSIPGNVDDIQLSDNEMDEIENAHKLTVDLDYADALSEKGQVVSVNVLPPPREFDPEMLTWKGGSVYGRLKVVNEMWITYEDWDTLESRSLYYKSLFNY